MKRREIINAVISLPVEERALIIDSLLQSLNKPESEIDKKWAVAAKRRQHEIHSGSVNSVPGTEVFERVWKKFEK